VVEEIGACNCIKIKDGYLEGFNTDVIGFENSLSEKLVPDDRRALILGTGGSSKAVAWVLKKRGIEYLFVTRKETGARHINYSELSQEMIESNSLIINTTPLGMSPDTGRCPPLPYEWINSSHYFFDLIYNPGKTLFLERGEHSGARIKNGSDMLVIQAEASWDIWNS
jgi:shikimate dehydrogenase